MLYVLRGSRGVKRDIPTLPETARSQRCRIILRLMIDLMARHLKCWILPTVLALGCAGVGVSEKHSAIGFRMKSVSGALPYKQVV